MYTKNETALLTLISNINNQFYYIGEEDDQVAPIDVKKFTEHCVAFIDSLEIDKDDDVTFYYLKNDTLTNCQLETIIETDMGVEFTIQDTSELLEEAV